MGRWRNWKQKLGSLGAERRLVASAGRRLLAATEENDLLTYASAMAFRIIFALPAVLLAGLAVLGFLDLQGVWEAELAPRLEQALPPDIFELVSENARSILAERSGFWLSLGLAIALWYMSGATRALMGVMNAIYHDAESRGNWRRLGVSLLLTLTAALCLGLAAVVLYLSPLLLERMDLGVGLSLLAGVLRWILALLLLAALLSAFLRFAPARRGRHQRNTLTALIIIGGWLLTSRLFLWYVTSLADYESVFGNLASVMILMAYLYLSAVVLLYGLQIDAMIREELGRNDAVDRS